MMIKESKHTATSGHQIKESKRGSKEHAPTKQPGKKINKMTIISPYLSTITLNVSGLNSPIKRQNGRMNQKQDPTVCCLQETYFSLKNTHRLRVKRCKKVFQANDNQKKAIYICIYQTKETLNEKWSKEAVIIHSLYIFMKKM